MRVLVTGGTGFIGTALCARLLHDGHQVTVLTRDRDRAARHFKGAVGAIENLNELGPRLAPQVIVNLAGQSLGGGRWTEERKQAFRASRIGVTERVVDYVARAKSRPKLLISASAVGYYGAGGDSPLSEDSGPGDEYQAHLCRDWELMALRSEAFGVRVCLSRSGVVLGRGGGALSTLLPPFKMGLGGWVGDGKQWMSWIHRDDLVSAFVRFIADESLCGPFNVTSPTPETNRYFAGKLGAVLGRPGGLRVPCWVVRVLVGEMAHLYLTGQKVLPKKLLESGFEFQYPDLTQALQEILN